MNRIFSYDNLGKLKDFTISIGKYFSENTAPLNTAVIVAVDVPLNALSFMVHENAVSTDRTTIVEFWDGLKWVTAPDVIDETNGFSKSGRVTFYTGKNDIVGSDDSTHVPELRELALTQKYFYKFRTSDGSPMRIDFIGNLFCKENEVFSLYPELHHAETIENFASNKENWNDQIYIASVEVLRDLIAKNLIEYSGQLLDVETLVIPTVHKVAHIVYSSFGDVYASMRDEALKQYYAAIAKVRPAIDKNNNGRPDPVEVTKRVTVGRFYR